MTGIPAPVRSWWSEPFWDGLDRGVFLLQRCAVCGVRPGYPKPRCPACGATDLTFEPSSGLGTVYTATTVVANPPSTFLGELPYVLVVVELDEGVRYLARYEGDHEPKCGDRVRAVFEPRPDGVRVPTFAAAGAA